MRMDHSTNLVKCGRRLAWECAFIEIDSGIATKVVSLFGSANTCHRLTMFLSRSTNAILHVVPEPFNFKANAKLA